MFGFLNINKPSGPTSHDIVARVRQRLPRKTRVGHAGTLDPFAEGVLVVCVGPATRLADYVQAQPKRYRAEVTLGATSTTDDIEGEITEAPNGEPAPENKVREALKKFVGEIMQAPPSYSAVHVNGKRAYKLARKGETPVLPARQVVIHSIKLLRYEYPLLEIDVRCGSGTYIRALARDIGSALGVGGYCSALTRTEVGVLNLEKAKSPDALDPARDIISPLVALGSLEKITVDETDVHKLAMGQNVLLKKTFLTRGQIAVIDACNELIALATVSENGRTLHGDKVFISHR